MNQREREQEASGSDFVQVLCLEEEIASLEKKIITAKGSLEYLENEIALAEQRKKDTETLINTVQKNAEKKEQELYEKIKTLTEQKEGMEEQSRALSVRYGVLSDDLNKITGTLQEKKDELKKVMDELDAARREIKKRKLMSGAVLIFFISLITIMFYGLIYFDGEISKWEGLYQDVMAEKEEGLVNLAELKDLYQGAETEKEEALTRISELEGSCQDMEGEKEEALAKISELEGLYQDTNTEKEKVLKRLSEMESYASPVMIKINKIYNGEKGGKKISDNLKSSEMRYLRIDFSGYFLKDNVNKAMIYLDIYKPDGSLKFSSNSPSGHTYSCSFEAKNTGSIKTVQEDSGWGNSSESTYPAGIYRIDFVYENKIIYSQKIEIKP